MTREEALGGAAHEAARLVEALGEWLGTHASADGPAWTQTGEEAIATGTAECRLCPVCRLIAIARAASPEVVAHLDDALRSLLAALKCAGPARTSSNGSGSGFETIVIT
ncbi:MAG: hypothetical protein ACT4QF_18255 [Sporichthyaceae bacterium]